MPGSEVRQAIEQTNAAARKKSLDERELRRTDAAQFRTWQKEQKRHERELRSVEGAERELDAALAALRVLDSRQQPTRDTAEREQANRRLSEAKSMLDGARERAESNNKLYAWTGFLLLLVACLVLKMLGPPSQTPGSLANTGDPLDAWIMAERLVTERLKAPSTADFPSYDQSYVQYLGNDRYCISAYVDAQNGFGAKLRTDFVVIVNLRGGHGSLEACEFYPR